MSGDRAALSKGGPVHWLTSCRPINDPKARRNHSPSRSAIAATWKFKMPMAEIVNSATSSKKVVEALAVFRAGTLIRAKHAEHSLEGEQGSLRALANSQTDGSREMRVERNRSGQDYAEGGINCCSFFAQSIHVSRGRFSSYGGALHKAWPKKSNALADQTFQLRDKAVDLVKLMDKAWESSSKDKGDDGGNEKAKSKVKTENPEGKKKYGRTKGTLPPRRHQRPSRPQKQRSLRRGRKSRKWKTASQISLSRASCSYVLDPTVGIWSV